MRARRAAEHSVAGTRRRSQAASAALPPAARHVGVVSGRRMTDRGATPTTPATSRRPAGRRASSSCSTPRAALEQRLLERLDRRHHARRASNGDDAIADPAVAPPPRARRLDPRLEAPPRHRRRSAARAAARRLAAARSATACARARLSRPADLRRSARPRARCARRGCCAATRTAAASSPASRRRSPSCASAGARRRRRRRPDHRPRRVRRAPGGAGARARRAPPARRALQGAALRARGHPRAPGLPRRRRAPRARARPRRGRASRARRPRYLREIAATHSPYVIDLAAHLIRLLYTRGYGEALHYDRAPARGASTRSAQRHPVVFLPSHKSNLDHLVLQYALHENGHPPNHTAGGINMNFFPVGPAGAAQRRLLHPPHASRTTPVYKFVLRQYIDYLIEKRFSLEWYIEGGRSRSGKLLPPRFGLLAYVVDAYRRGKSEDVYLIPVVDRLRPDPGRRRLRRRAARRAPRSARASAGSCACVRRLRRRYGDIHIRFGEPLSLARALGPPEPERRAERRRAATSRCRSSPSRSRCASTA